MRIPILSAFVLILLSVLVDLYIRRDIREYEDRHSKGKKDPHRWSKIYWISSIICWIYVMVVLLIPRRDGNSGITSIMWMLVAYLSVYVPKWIYCLFSLLGKIPRLWKGRQIPLGTFVGLPLGIAFFCIMWWGVFVTRKEIQVNDVTVTSARLPKGFDGYRIAQISDLHTGTWGNDTTFISRLVDEINAQKPDLIVFTGDIVNRNTSELLPFVSVLSRLQAPDGVYSILGNHDYGFYQDWDSEADKDKDHQLLIDLQKEMGWKLLNNSHEDLHRGGDAIMLVGVENWGEPPFDGVGDLDTALKMMYAGGARPDSLPMPSYKLLLSHNPEHWRQKVLEHGDIDLTLSGHTHASQMMVKIGGWQWAPIALRYEQWAGMYNKESADKLNALIYVNIGAGEVGMPVRMLAAKPEITIFTLKADE